MEQPGVEVRPIVQITGGGEFNEVFFDGARTGADLVVGEVGEGWRVAMALLGFERGVSTLAQQVGFERELDHVFALGVPARPRSAIRSSASGSSTHGSGCSSCGGTRMRSMSARGVPGPGGVDLEAVLGHVAPRARQPRHRPARRRRLIGEALPYELTLEQKLFLFSRADTIYGGSNEIQRNVLGERVLGLPREPT